MAQKNRSKEVWLIPKRVNLHQTICLIDGLIERNYSGTSWSAQKQNNLGVNLKKWGATNNGKNVSAQAVRTLTASIPQYLGFVYINNNTTPNTICITEAGMNLWNKHKDELVKIKNLRDGKDKLIKTSDIVLQQMEKLQITNPIILKDCENILVFPFRMCLKLLLELDYLDREELAYIVFAIKDETEYNLAIEKVKKFRKMDYQDRKDIIETFKQTHIGNITLVQAPSAGYYESLCMTTGIINKIYKVIPNPNNLNHSKLTAIAIKDDYKKYVRNIINNKYYYVDAYDFKQDLSLWIDYIGNPNRIAPPKNVSIVNNSNSSLLICVKKDGILLDGDLISIKNIFTYPMFMDEKYEIECIDINSGNIIYNESIIPTNTVDTFRIDFKSLTIDNNETFEQIASEILEHSSSNKFSSKMLNYLSILYKIDGRSREDDKSLRGAYYEFLFYRLLSCLVNKGIVDEIVWNGRVGKYGLPSQAPGGITGTADMIFKIDNLEFVLELTTIKPKSTQFKAEGASVPDHIRLYNSKTSNEVIGIFCAPLIHSRNTSVMQSSLENEKIKLICITDKELLNILKLNNRKEIIFKLMCFLK